MKYQIFLWALMSLLVPAWAQNYTSYFTGNTTDLLIEPTGGLCLMGGASEDDNAMTWFLQQANGGDVLVLRATGSDGYNTYMYSDLGVGLNSVETIVFNNAAAADETYIHQKIQNAEAIWITGGDQWDYISYWRHTAIDSLINLAISNRNIVIGGTSAGMAIQGGFYFSAEHSTVTSTIALSNPFDSNVTVDSAAFISNLYMQHVITDTHYDNPDRKGRHMVFMARIWIDYGIAAKGIACDEYTAVCIDANGQAKVYGDYPSYDDNAYFIQSNCELTDISPENCTSGQPLDWNLGNAAVKVYKVKGTSNGTYSFDLNDWQTGSGGVWEDWYVDQGVLNQQVGLAPDCNTVFNPELDLASKVSVYPNPIENNLYIEFDKPEFLPQFIELKDALGRVYISIAIRDLNSIQINTSDFSSGIYFLELKYSDKSKQVKKLFKS